MSVFPVSRGQPLCWHTAALSIPVWLSSERSQALASLPAARILLTGLGSALVALMLINIIISLKAASLKKLGVRAWTQGF